MFNPPVPDKILFIANPTSRNIDRDEIQDDISRFSEKYGFSWEIYYTEKDEYDLKISHRINQYNPGLVVAIGGDGTINPVATALIGSNIELGIIPAGSANGLAYNLGLPSGFRDAMNLILNETAKPMDAVVLNDKHHCYHLGDVGINARIVKRFEQEGSKGLLGYGIQMLKEIFSGHDNFSFKLLIRNSSRRFRAELIAVANARYFGTGAVINPAGRIDDGKFEIIIIKPYPWWAVFHLVRMMLFGRINHRKFVRVLSVTEAEISFDRKQDVQVDGEIIPNIDRLELKILPGAIRVRYGNLRQPAS
jgi:diacylglycerol kinase (ATP)